MVDLKRHSVNGAPATGRKAAAPYQRSFPLVALFQLATCWAALAMCVDGNQLREVVDRQGNIRFWTWEPWAALAGAMLPAAALGFLMGLSQLRMWRSSAFGALVGGLCGLAMLAVYLAPAPLVRVAAASAMVLGTTIAFRVGSD